jgi:hypothetical protein
VKYVVSLIKQQGSTTTPEVQLDGLKIIGKALGKISDAKVIEIMPGISSIATKVLSCDIKTNSKIKIEFVNIWISLMLHKYLKSLPSKT